MGNETADLAESYTLADGTRLFANYTDLIPESPDEIELCKHAWRIGHSGSKSFSLRFGRKLDVLLAMKALIDHGVKSLKEIQDMPDDEAGRIIASSLQW